MSCEVETPVGDLSVPGLMMRRNSQALEKGKKLHREWAFGSHQEDKEEGIFRFGMVNIRGLPRSSSDAKADLFHKWATLGEYDALLLQELNGNFSNYGHHELPYTLLHDYWKWTSINIQWLKSARREKFQYGGTAIITNDRLASCTWKKGGDEKNMGRWAWNSFRGKNNMITTVITLYFPHPSKDAGSVEGQQLQHLVEKYPGERRQPFVEFKKDLRSLLTSEFDQGHRVIVAGDFNCQVTKESNPIVNLLKQFGMSEAILGKYGTEEAPPTRRPGSEQIDGVFISPGLEITRGGYIENEMSDHLIIWFDIKDTIFLGQGLEPFVKPKARRLQLKNPKVKRIYNELVEQELTRRNISMRRTMLAEMTERGADFRQIPELASLYESVYECNDRAVKYADKRCRKIRGGGIPYSDTVANAIGKVVIWRMILARMNKKGQFGRPTIKHIKRKAKKWNFEEEWRSLNRAQIREKLSDAQTLLRIMKPTAKELRHTYLAKMADECAMELGGDSEDHYKRLQREEEEAQSWLRIRIAQGKMKGGLCSQVEKENEDGSRTLITEMNELIEEIISANESKLQQSNPTPLRNEPLRTYFAEDGEDYKVWEEIRNGKRKIPDEWDIDEGTRLLMDKLTQKRGEPVDITWTEEEYHESWKKMREATVSAPGLHFGHYKAPEPKSLASLVNTTLANVPLRTGYVPKAWKKCTNSMIVKKSNDLRAGKLRLITLLQAQCNHNGKRAGKCMMHNAEKLKMMAPEQYGSRKRKSSRVHALNKRLLLDAMIQAKKPLVLIANDATSCYDRILLLIAYLTFREFGLSEPVAICLIDCLRLMVHNIRTCYGDSDQTYGGDKWERSPHGNGQGNGTGPTLWAGISSLLLDIMRDHDFGVKLHSAISSVAMHLVGFSFVDDTDLVQEGETGQDAMEKAQQSLNLWESVLWATGGAIEPTKSDWALVDYQWSGGKWKFKPASNANVLRVRGPNGAVSNLKQLRYNEARETLGVWQAADGQEKTQTEKLLKKVEEWVGKVRSFNIPTNDVARAIRFTVTEKIRYGLIATSMTEKQCKSIMDPVIKGVMPKLRIARNMKRETVHGRRDLLGLEIEGVHVMQTSEKVQALLNYGGTSTHTGDLISNTLELHLLEIGMGGNIFNMDGKITPMLMEKTWLRDAIRSMEKYRLSIDSKHEMLKLWREGDSFIMEKVCEAYRRRDGITKQHMRSINRCRRYLNVTTVSDISDGTGRYMMKWAMECERPTVLSHTSSSAYKWPPHGKPSAQDRAIWKQALVDIYGTGSKNLRSRLGIWKNEAVEHQKWKYDPTHDRLYQNTDGGWIVWKRSMRRMVRSAKYLPQGPIDRDEAEQAESVPTVYCGNNQSCILQGYSQFEEVTEQDCDNDYIHQFTTNPKFGWAIGTIKMEDNGIEQITDAIENNTAKVVTDGSTKDKKSSSGFLFIGENDTNIFEGGNYVPGRCKDQNSFRAELGGILALVLIINYICEKRKITEGSITLACDNDSALDHAFDLHLDTMVNTPSYDIVRRIKREISKSPITWKKQYVKGHQDDHANYEKLDTWGKANCRAHNLAKEHMDNHPGDILKGFEADAGWGLVLDGVEIHGKVKDEIYRHCTDQQLQKYWAERNGFDEEAIDIIDWELMETASNDHPEGRRRWLTKHVACNSATGRNMLRRKEWATDQCPVCKQEDESSHHLIKCQGDGMQNTYEESMDELEVELKKYTRTDVTEAIIMYMEAIRHDHNICINNEWKEDLQETLEQQKNLGHLAFLHGFWVKGWHDIQMKHLEEIESKRTATKCLADIIRKIWDVSFDLWRFRCKYAHGSDKIRELLLTANTIDDTITDLYARIPNRRLLAESERRALLGFSEEKVKGLRFHAKKRWVERAQKLIHNFEQHGIENPPALLMRAWLGQIEQPN